MKKKDPTSHRIIEKRRRDRMNNCLADLSKLIPAHYMKKGRGRIEKTEIIELAIRHLKDLIERQNDGSSQTQQVEHNSQLEESYHQSQNHNQQQHQHQRVHHQHQNLNSNHTHSHNHNHRPHSSIGSLSHVQGSSSQAHSSQSHHNYNHQAGTTKQRILHQDASKGSCVAMVDDQSHSSSGSDNDSANNFPLSTTSCSSNRASDNYHQTGSQTADSSGSESSGSSSSSSSSSFSTSSSSSSSALSSCSSSSSSGHQKSSAWYKKAWITRSNHLRSPP